MTGIELDFKQQVETSKDDLNNPVYSLISVLISDCLVAPITEPASAREQQAMEQSKDQIRIHLPKTFTGSIANSFLAWGGKVFSIDSDSVVFMEENTPGRWNRYFRGESVSRNDANVPDTILKLFVTEDSEYVLVQESN